jgi:hypothetical protein
MKNMILRNRFKVLALLLILFCTNNVSISQKKYEYIIVKISYALAGFRWEIDTAGCSEKTRIELKDSTKLDFGVYRNNLNNLFNFLGKLRWEMILTDIMLNEKYFYFKRGL